MSTQTADPFASPCTALRVRKAARLLSQVYDRHLERFGLTITQYGLLRHIQRLDGIGLGELAEKLVMDPTTLTRNLRPLERQGYVVMAPDPRDRRARLLYLTETGRKVADEARAGWAEAQRHVEQRLGRADTASLNAALDRALELLAS